MRILRRSPVGNTRRHEATSVVKSTTGLGCLSRVDQNPPQVKSVRGTSFAFLRPEATGWTRYSKALTGL
jgi:hypothetical protein